ENQLGRRDFFSTVGVWLAGTGASVTLGRAYIEGAGRAFANTADYTPGEDKSQKAGKQMFHLLNTLVVGPVIGTLGTIASFAFGAKVSERNQKALAAIDQQKEGIAHRNLVNLPALLKGIKLESEFKAEQQAQEDQGTLSQFVSVLEAAPHSTAKTLLLKFTDDDDMYSSKQLVSFLTRIKNGAERGLPLEQVITGNERAELLGIVAHDIHNLSLMDKKPITRRVANKAVLAVGLGGAALSAVGGAAYLQHMEEKVRFLPADTTSQKAWHGIKSLGGAGLIAGAGVVLSVLAAGALGFYGEQTPVDPKKYQAVVNQFLADLSPLLEQYAERNRPQAREL
ncbi:MAG: hypothetical protein Q8O19_02335, partial [Rectinemataceae bacterium]|nr:hypothetical protein [Rectinemataceae bacterium]